MMAGLNYPERLQPPRFLGAFGMLKDVIETEGAAEHEKAKSRCFVEDNSDKKVVNIFETLKEDNILLSEKSEDGWASLHLKMR
jgi:hypothetical protein